MLLYTIKQTRVGGNARQADLSADCAKGLPGGRYGLTCAMVVTFALLILLTVGFATPAFADDADDAADKQNYSGVEVTSGNTHDNTSSTDDSKEDDLNCSIVLHEMPQINLVSEKLTIPIRAINTCTREIQVHLSGSADDDSRLEVISSLDVTLKPNSENVLDLPVHAKSNGDSRLNVTLTSEDGKNSSITIEVHSVRDIGKAMSILFYAGVSVLLVGGVWRTVKKSRMRRGKSSPKKKMNCCAKGA